MRFSECVGIVLEVDISFVCAEWELVWDIHTCSLLQHIQSHTSFPNINFVMNLLVNGSEVNGVCPYKYASASIQVYICCLWLLSETNFILYATWIFWLWIENKSVFSKSLFAVAIVIQMKCCNNTTDKVSEVTDSLLNWIMCYGLNLTTFTGILKIRRICIP